jgi:AcrR family transcriptional regulator
MTTTPTPTPTTSAARPRLSADDWVAAGLHLLTEEGVAGIKIDALAERLGVTKGSFYWHFKSLTAFLEVMAERFIARQDAQLASFAATAPADPRERLLAMMNRISDPHTASLERAIRGWAYEHPGLARHVDAVDHWAHAVVVAAFECLGFAGHEAEVRAKTLYYAGVGRLHTGVLGEPEGPEHREQLLDLLTQR